MSFGTNTFCHKGHFGVINDKLSEHEFETRNLNKNCDGQIFVMKNIMSQTSVAGIQVEGENARHKNYGLITITVTFIATLRVIISDPMCLSCCCHIHHSCILPFRQRNQNCMNAMDFHSTIQYLLYIFIFYI